MIQSPAGYQGDVRIKRYLDFYQAGYGVAMLSSGVAFSPLSLFANGEQGGWYDPSDLTTLFQDAAGTTPVTAVEQPVGRVLDKSGRGNHLSQSTSTARPVLSARVNLLLNTATLATQSVTTVATTYTLAFSGAGSITLSGTATGTYSAGSNSITCTAGTLTLTVSGTVTNADLRPTNAGVGLPAYQRVGAATDYDTTGFPYYIKHDGIDDRLLSANGAINTAVISSAIGTAFSATGNVLFGISHEAAAHTDPYFRFVNFINVGVNINIRIDGVASTSPTSSKLNKAYVLETYTAASRNAVIQNGSTLFTPTTATITYPNSTPLIVGANAVGSEALNGGWYNLVIIGRDLTDAERTSLRTYMNAKTKAF